MNDQPPALPVPPAAAVVQLAPGADAVPPPSGPRKVLLIVAGIFGGVLVLATVVALLALFVAVPMWRASSPDWLADHAVQRVQNAKVLSYDGGFIDDDGRRVKLQVSVANDRLAGTQTVDGERAEFLVNGTGTYVRASQAYWEIVEPHNAGMYADRWLLTSVAALRMPIDPYLEPARLAESLHGALLEDKPTLTMGEERTIGGVRAARISSSARGSVYIGLESPYQVLRIEGQLVSGSYDTEALVRGYAFDVAEAASDEADAFARRFDAIGKIAAGALNPARAETLPAYYEIEQVIEGKSECGDVSCRIEADVQNLYGPAQPGAKHLLIGVVWAGKGDTGKVLARCETTLKPMPKEKPTRVTCVSSDPRWARWDGAGGWYSYNALTFNPGWHGDSLAVTTRLIEAQTDLNNIFDLQEDGGALALNTYARLLRYPGVKPADALNAVRSAAKLHQLDVVHAYATSGRLGNVAGLSALLTSAASQKHDLDTLLTHVSQLHAAAERAKGGTGPVSLRTGSGDVVDAGRKEVLQRRTVGSLRADDVVKEARDASGAAKAPAGYRTIVELRIAHMENPLRELRKAALRDAIKKAGLAVTVDTLVIENSAGRHTYTAADFK